MTAEKTQPPVTQQQQQPKQDQQLEHKQQNDDADKDNDRDKHKDEERDKLKDQSIGVKEEDVTNETLQMQQELIKRHEEYEARLQPTTVNVIAQSISHLPMVAPSASRYLAPDAEYRIRQLIQDALKFMRHSKRNRLLTDDVNSALRLRNTDPIFGFNSHSQSVNYTVSPAASSKYVKPSAMKNSADHQHNSITLSNAINNASFANVHGVPNLYFTSDKELHLQKLLLTPLPALPLEPTVRAHWLAIDAKQPAIPQNPSSSPSNAQSPNQHGRTLSGALTQLSASLQSTSLSLSSSPQLKQQQRGSNKAVAISVSSSHNNNSSVLVGQQQHHRKRKRTPKMDGSVLSPEIKPRIKHNLSRELQFYYDYVRQSIFKNDAQLIDNCLLSISQEHGIIQLLPYLSSFISQSVKNHLNDLPLLYSLMRLFNAILDNRNFKVENYLHQLLPSLITCIVGKRLCANSAENHWALRDYASFLFRKISNRYEKQYIDLKKRFVVTLLNALNSLNRPLTTHYGAIIGFTALGSLTINKTIVPKLPTYAKNIVKVLDSAGTNKVRRKEAAKVYFALAWAISITVKEKKAAADSPSPSTDAEHDVDKGEDGSDKEKGERSAKSKIGEELSEEDIVFSPQDIESLIPQASRLIPILEKEYGKDVHPLGIRAFKEQVAQEILKTAPQQRDS